MNRFDPGEIRDDARKVIDEVENKIKGAREEKFMDKTGDLVEMSALSYEEGGVRTTVSIDDLMGTEKGFGKHAITWLMPIERSANYKETVLSTISQRLAKYFQNKIQEESAGSLSVTLGEENGWPLAIAEVLKG